MKRILIIQTASLGDVVLSTPIIEKLHRFFPDARIDFLVKQSSAALLRRHPYLHHIMVWVKNEKKYHNLWELIKIVKKEKYDLIVNVQRYAASGLITALSGAEHRVGFKKNPLSLFFTKRIKHKIGNVKNKIHETERNLKLIEHLTDNSFVMPKLYPSPHDEAYVSQYKTRKYITISPASLWFTKQYPKEKWIEFVTGIDNDIQVYFLGAKDDKRLCDEIIVNSKHKNSLNLAGKMSLLQSAALMRNAIINYTNDSAPMHLASAVNGTVAAIFCSTVPEFGFGPLSEKSYIIQTHGNLKCRPCGLHGLQKCPKKHFKCAYSINKNQLLSCL